MKDNWKNTKHKLHIIIFEADTPTGKLFDIALIIAILLSVGAVMLDSIKPINIKYGNSAMPRNIKLGNAKYKEILKRFVFLFSF